MIKKWQIYFVCIFSVLFVSLYFVADAMFFATDEKVVLPPPIIAEEDLPPIEDNDTVEPPETDIKPEDPQEQKVPTYANGYECMQDALDRFYASSSYTWSFSSTANSLGIVQKVQGNKTLNQNSYKCETYAYCDSSFGRTFYERVTSSDLQNYDYIRTDKVNAKLEYDINGITPTTHSKQDIINMGGGKLDVFLLPPKKGRDSLAKFDKYSSNKYYIISFVMNVDELSEYYVNSVRNEANASDIQYKYVRSTYYVSKTTGKIEKYEQEESYSLTIGIRLDVKYVCSGRLKSN